MKKETLKMILEKVWKNELSIENACEIIICEKDIEIYKTEAKTENNSSIR